MAISLPIYIYTHGIATIIIAAIIVGTLNGEAQHPRLGVMFKPGCSKAEQGVCLRVALAVDMGLGSIHAENTATDGTLADNTAKTSE